jgi:hypothetical protein
MNNTLKRLREFLADDGNFRFKKPAEGFMHTTAFSYYGVRKPFVLANGDTISVQQSATHYTHSVDQVEMWHCPHHPLLDSYGTGEDPYAYVPVDVCAAYIDAVEKGEVK